MLKKNLSLQWTQSLLVQNKFWGPQYKNQGLCNMSPIHSLPLLPHLFTLNWSPVCCSCACFILLHAQIVLFFLFSLPETSFLISACQMIPHLNYSLILILTNLYSSVKFLLIIQWSDSCFFWSSVTFNHVWTLSPTLYWNYLISCFIHSQ